MRSCKFI